MQGICCTRNRMHDVYILHERYQNFLSLRAKFQRRVQSSKSLLKLKKIFFVLKPLHVHFTGNTPPRHGMRTHTGDSKRETNFRCQPVLYYLVRHTTQLVQKCMHMVSICMHLHEHIREYLEKSESLKHIQMFNNQVKQSIDKTRTSTYILVGAYVRQVRVWQCCLGASRHGRRRRPTGQDP